MKNATVLLADDDIDCLRLMALRCQALGLRVLTASDGMDALASVIRNSPDLLVLDINMPGGDGFSVAEKLMRDPKIPPTPVVFCSGGSDPASAARTSARTTSPREASPGRNCVRSSASC